MITRNLKNGLHIGACLIAFQGLLMVPSASSAPMAGDFYKIAQADQGIYGEVLEAGDRRTSSAIAFRSALTSSNPDLRKIAVLTLGRIGDDVAISRLRPMINDPDANVRLAVAFALGIVDGDYAGDSLMALIANEKNADILSRAYASLGLQVNSFMSADGREDHYDHLIKAFNETDDHIILLGIIKGLLHTQIFNPDGVRTLETLNPRKLVSLVGADEQSSQHHDDLADNVLYLMARMKSLPKVVPLALYETLFDVRRAMPHEGLLFRGLAQYGADGKQVFERYGLSRGDVNQVALLNRIMAVGDNRYAVYLRQGLDHPNSHVRTAAINGIAMMADDAPQKMSLLTRALQDNSTIIPDSARSNWVRLTALNVLSNINPDEAVERAIPYFEAGGYGRFKTLGVMAKTDKGQDYLASIDGARHPILKSYIDPEAIERLDHPTLKFNQVKEAFGKVLRFETSKGAFEMTLDYVAPYTASRFYELAKAGKYDGMAFHRVVPNFVAQAGLDLDGPQALADWGQIREELSMRAHTIGTVGVATSGKDTGSRQLFINLQPNAHLNDRYTVFADITAGMDVVKALNEGDIIEKVSVLP
mgnify:CR=1 FL=1